METTVKKQATEKQLAAVRAKREELKSLSKMLKPLVKEGCYDSVNEGLTAMYAEQGHAGLKTIRQWNKEGFKVKKGEHALLLWAKPIVTNRRQEQEQAGGNEENEDKKDFFPICFVFSQNQVERRA